MQSQKLTPTAEPTFTELDRFSIVEYMGVIVACLILVVLLALLWHLQGPDELSDFLGQAAAGWAQAIGAVVAIGASYKMGESSFKRQLIRDEISQLESRKHAFDVLHEVFSNAWAVDVASLTVFDYPERVPTVKALAEDALQQLSSIHVFSVPQASQMLQLNLCRQAMISYIRYATSWEEKGDSRILLKWTSFVNPVDSQKPRTSTAAKENCITQSAKLNEQILQLKQRLHG